ncbi:Alpha/Beta hydrolase protein [Podospora didyma]|uniref:Alpha/Beta hydrolase protein n=1 Tax=Podospora didyma TaxID=330526 RepID=A0AAE0NYA9_9PEZI|nr:Alpha/Beta hydrolase protein [Podospora didyma]
MPLPLQKATRLVAVHDVPLDCDIYEAADYPKSGPVFLFFHSGGLVVGDRSMVPPWLVQTCYKRQWPLLSASYRLLPQVFGNGLLDDAKAAYDFARSLGVGGANRHVIVGGASAGVFLATLIAHHLTPKPLALLSICGIPTFQHPFFNSSVLLPPDPITEEEVERYITEPVSIGKSPYSPEAVFSTEMLLPGGAKNPNFTRNPISLRKGSDQDLNRGLLYDYYLYENMFPILVGSSVDPGFDWTATDAEKLKQWPITILIQGDADDAVSPEVCSSVAEKLGTGKAVYCEAKGQDHLFEKTKFLEDALPGAPGSKAMTAVLKAINELGNAVTRQT